MVQFAAQSRGEGLEFREERDASAHGNETCRL